MARLVIELCMCIYIYGSLYNLLFHTKQAPSFEASPPAVHEPGTTRFCVAIGLGINSINKYIHIHSLINTSHINIQYI